MFYALSVLFFLLAGYCGITSLTERMQYGAWYPPQWTIGGTFGLDQRLLGTFGDMIGPLNAGWAFLLLTLLALLIAFQRSK